MLSILHPEPEIDPEIRKKIRLLTLFTAPFLICGATLLLMWFLMPAPRNWWLDVSNLLILVSLFLVGRTYRLRYPRRT